MNRIGATLKGLRLAGFKLLCIRRPALGRIATFSQRFSNQRSCQLLNEHEVREEFCSNVHQCTDDR
jgi:hypothetical protein